MIYYTADLHFGHENVIRFCGRPYETVEEMDRALLEGWNARVRSEDTVYIVGDLFYRNRRQAGEYLTELKGHKVLILGNHDHSWLMDNLRDSFEEVSQMMIIQDAGNRITLCHYPMMTWSGEKKGAYMVYGHIHNHAEDLDYWPLIARKDHMLNAGVDVNWYIPVTLQEMISNNATFRCQHALAPDARQKE